MQPGDVHAAVERRLGRPVSKDTTGSYLSVAASAATPAVRTGLGLYVLTQSVAHRYRR